MPKLKAKVVDLWISHTTECSNCGCGLLIKENPVMGDKITCPRCNAPMKVGDICGDYRSNKKTIELYAEEI